MEWTNAQREAIEARGGNLLVSAAAGSGKTAVLAARIVAIVAEGTSVDNLLVVTYTKAAAAEMRARILDELHKAAQDGNKQIAAQVMRVERAEIVTLHSFCGKVCRDYFQAADVDPTFRTADAAEAEMLREQALTEAITACYEENGFAFERAALSMSQPALLAAVSSLHTFLMARPDPWIWLQDAVAAHDTDADTLRESAWTRVLLSRVRIEAEMAVDQYERLVDHARRNGIFEAFATREAEMARDFLRAAEAGYDAVAAFPPIKFETKPRKTKDMDADAADIFTTLRDAAKKALKAAQDAFAPIADLARVAEDELDIGLVLAGLAQAVRMFHERYQQIKLERNVLDFNDLEHCALRALVHDAVADAIRAQYAHVFIDEYQDASLLQEAILQRVTRGDNLFMVGDVKQSIYRFRLAEPALFLQKQHDFDASPDAANRKVSLNANFRSLPTLLHGINDVFRRVFMGGEMELSYGEEEWLVPGREKTDADAPIELLLLTEQEDDESDAPTAADLPPEARAAVRQEANCIADRILALREEGSIHLRDVAVLMRSVKGRAVEMVEALRARGIAAWSDLGENALARPEVEAVLAVLRVVDNLRQDLPLIAAMRGPALGLSDHELAAIRVAQPEGTMADAVFAYAQSDDALADALRGFIERVRGWALDAQVMPLDSFLRLLYEETGHYAQSGARPDGALRQGNLRALAEHAGAYQRAQGSGLGGFLRYVERLTARGNGLDAQELGERDDVVRVMSIHKSKGLQFPVVFVAGLGRRFSGLDARKLLQLHASLGAGMQHVSPELWTRHPSLSQQAIVEQGRQESLAEEARVLYVAMTRAQDRLFLVGTPKDGDIDRWQSEAHSRPLAARCMLDWIAPTAMNSANWHVSLLPKQYAQETLTPSRGVQALIAHIDAEPAPHPDAEISRMLSWQAEDATRQPLKQSVSAVVRAEAKAGEREDTPLSFASLTRRPLFLEKRGLNATERGDAVHAFLRAVPLNAQDLEAERRSLIERGLLSAEQAKTLPMAKLRHSMAGPLWARMRKAEILHREWPFNLRISQDGNTTLLQGIIDCCFMEDGQWILVDYKTDRAEDLSALLSHYRPQLALYARALEEITGIPVRERILYLIEREEGYDV